MIRQPPVDKQSSLLQLLVKSLVPAVRGSHARIDGEFSEARSLHLGWKLREKNPMIDSPDGINIRLELGLSRLARLTEVEDK